MKPLFIFEMANNHMGDINHGLEIIEKFSQTIDLYPEFEFAIKFQYRNLETFIHQEFKTRTDIHYINRFLSTKLNEKEFNQLREKAKQVGFKTICTPFDNESVQRIINENFDYIKIASCSCSDLPLIEDILKAKKPVIASLGGAKNKDILKLCKSFKENNVPLYLLHCVPEYPTQNQHSHLGQIQFLKDLTRSRFIGFSTHEDPNDTDNIKMAISQGAMIFEKHIGLANEKYSLNKYSANYEQVINWLKSAHIAFQKLGNKDSRMTFNQDINESLQNLQRGLYASSEIKEGQEIKRQNVYLAFPPNKNQLRSNCLSENIQLIASCNIKPHQAITNDSVVLYDRNPITQDSIAKAQEIINSSAIIIPSSSTVIASFHYGIENFNQHGAILINIMNKVYSKKYIVLLPNQNHPEHYHRNKTETFIIIKGEVNLSMSSKKINLKIGDMIDIPPLSKHSFESPSGAIIEEISTEYFPEDSYYTDEKIHQNQNRKKDVSKYFSF